MSYLPDVLNNVKILITVKTYPLPSNKYEELVCTAGVLKDECGNLLKDFFKHKRIKK